MTLEIEPRHAEVARANIARAGLADVVDVRLGRALDTLAALEKEGGNPSTSSSSTPTRRTTPRYFRSAMTMSRPGTVIVVDNAIRRVAIAEPGTTDPDVVGTRAVLELMGKEPRVSATAIQTVGSKGYDGFALAVVGD